MKRAAPWLFVLAGCSLIVGPEVPAEDGGSEGGGSAAGGGVAGGAVAGGGEAGGSSGGAAGGTAGGTSGGTAGGGVAGGAGGGTGGGGTAGGGASGGSVMPCPGSTLPRLACSQFVLQTGGLPSYPWMSAHDGGFLAAWGDSDLHFVKLVQVQLDGGVNPLASEPSTGGVDVVVAGAGEHWVLAWRDANGSPSKCTSSVDAGVVIIDSGTVAPIRQGVAISPSGAVAAIAFESFSSSAWHAESALGCPSEYTVRHSTFSTVKGVNVVHRTPKFLFTLSGYSVDGELQVFSAPDAGRTRLGLEHLSDHSAALSDDGAFVQLAAGVVPDGLVLRSVRADLSQPISASATHTLPNDISAWNSASCGSDCFAIAFNDLPPSGQGRVRVFFTDVTSTPRAVPEYDVICGVPRTAYVGVAYFGGKLGVIATRTSSVELQLCDIPPP